MKPHPRIRKTIKWGGAAVTLLLVVVWIGSGWWAIDKNTRFMTFSVVGGEGVFLWYPFDYQLPKEWQVRYRKPGPSWNGAGTWDTKSDSWVIAIPLWIPALGSLAIGMIAWRLDTLARRRARLNLCPKCNYDRAGIAADAVCPECGCA
jgi:hypothetical protein